MKEYQQCKRCIMDNTSDDTITFDENGYCNYCTEALMRKGKVYFPNETGKRKLNTIINSLKEKNKGKKYDCVMGISGGLDSSYLAYLGAVKWNLRILALHVDDSFDTEISKENIKKLVKKTHIDFEVICPDQKQYNELTRAYMMAGVPNLAVPQDNILFANLYKRMKIEKIETFLSGGNFALESILQMGNTHDSYDVTNIKNINKLYGRDSIDKLDFISNFGKDLNSMLLGIKIIRPLDLIDYNKDKAFEELYDFCGFEYYGSKHLENKLTKFIQLYWFFNKFGVDKRKSHLSSMIVSDQLTRDEAIKLIENPLYNDNEMQNEIKNILEKLDISIDEFTSIMMDSPKQHTDYKTSIYNVFRKKLRKMLK